MNKWHDQDPAIRRAATYKFCKMLEEDPALRKACQEDKDKAWDTLRQAGEFEDMPHHVSVYVFEDAINSNDQVVTLVLPEPGDLGSEEQFDPGRVWRCTWNRYLE